MMVRGGDKVEDVRYVEDEGRRSSVWIWEMDDELHSKLAARAG